MVCERLDNRNLVMSRQPDDSLRNGVTGLDLAIADLLVVVGRAAAGSHVVEVALQKGTVVLSGVPLFQVGVVHAVAKVDIACRRRLGRGPVLARRLQTYHFQV